MQNDAGSPAPCGPIAPGEIRETSRDVFGPGLLSHPVQIPEPRSPLGDIIETIDAARELKDPRAKEVIEESEKRFASFMNHLPGFAWIKDLQGKYVFANKYCQVLPSYINYVDYLGKTDEELWPAEIAAEYRANDRKVIETGAAIQRRETLLLHQQHRALRRDREKLQNFQSPVL